MSRHRQSAAAAAPAALPHPGSFATPALAIFAVALALRLLHLWNLRDAPFFSVLMGDARAYDAWAQRLAGGDWIGSDVFFQAPLYPYLLGAIYAVAGRDLLVVRAVQAVVGAAAAMLLGYAGWRLLSRRAGVVAGLLLAVWAPAIFLDSLLQKSALDVFFVCAMLALVGRIQHAPAPAWPWALLGVVMGGLALTRENALVLLAVIAVWLVAVSPPAARLRNALLVAACVGAVLVPVAARNAAVGGGFYLTTSQFGASFYIGNHAGADGSYAPLRPGRGAPEYEREDGKALAEQALGRPLTPSEVSQYWASRSLAFITGEPLAWLRLMGRKALLLLNRTEVLDTESQESYAEYSWPLRLLGPVTHFGVLVPLAGVGLAVLWPRRRDVWVIYALAATYGASLLAFFIVARYRYPLVPMLLIFAAGALVAARPAGGASRLEPAAARRLPPWVLGLAVVLAVVANWPVLSPALMRAITENNLASVLQEEHRLEDAIRHYERALAEQPDYVPALVNLGTAYREANRLDDAVAAYERAIAVAPESSDAYFNLGNAALAAGQVDRAVDAFRRALEREPASIEIGTNLANALATRGDRAGAIAAMQRATQANPTSATAFRNLGTLLAAFGAGEDARRAFRKGAELAPGDAVVRYDYGAALVAAGQFAAAEVEFRAAIAARPDYAEAFNNLGIALASQGRLAEAIDAFERAVRLQPGFAAAQQNLALARDTR